MAAKREWQFRYCGCDVYECGDSLQAEHDGDVVAEHGTVEGIISLLGEWQTEQERLQEVRMTDDLSMRKVDGE